MSNKRFFRIPMSELRVSLPKLRHKVQFNKCSIVCTRNGETAAFLLSLHDAAVLQIDAQKSEELSLTEFRQTLTEAWEKLQDGTDCIYLTFHNRRVVAFVSDRIAGNLAGGVS